MSERFDDDQERPRFPRNWTPVPDPTLLTTEALQREIAALRELLETKIEASSDLTEQKIKNLHGLFDAARVAQEEANTKALDSIDKRFENVNEFRGALTDLSARMATRDQLDGLSEKVETERSSLEARFEALYQRNRGDIDSLGRRLDLRQGEDQGARLTKGTLFTAIGLAIAFLTFIILIANYLTTH